MRQDKRARLKRTAFQEAGHAVVGLFKGMAPHHVTIVESDGALGHCDFGLPPKWVRRGEEACTPVRTDWLEQQVEILLAGPLAESKYAGRFGRIGASDDWSTAADLALRRCGSGDEATLWLKWLDFRTRSQINLRWSQITVIAERLLERATLSSDDVRKIVFQNGTR
jgi:hypothetical protein